MKKRFAACFFALLAAVFTVAAAVLAFRFRNASPVLLSASPEPAQRAEELMEALCSGNFDGAEAVLYGNPDLGADRAPEDPVSAMIWNAYVESLDYRLEGDCYASDSGLAQDVKLIHMDLPSVTEQLGSRTKELLSRRLEEAEDVSEIYDENNEYRSELVQEALLEAAAQALEEDARYAYKNITLQLVYSQGQWWVAADEALLKTVAGTAE